MSNGISAGQRPERATPAAGWARSTAIIDLRRRPTQARPVVREHIARDHPIRDRLVRDPADTATPAKGLAVVGGGFKRGFDVMAAIAALVLLLPLVLLIGFAIKAWDRGPMFYRHRRIGLNGAPFDCIKFRTMVVDADTALRHHLATNREAAREWEETQKLKRDPRITPLGASLRKTSIDELPQLFNILKGEMSLVGPRPIVTDEVPKYGDCIEHYLRARPGLTGAWQVSGRNDVDYATRVALDRHYVENWKFRHDLAIIAKTARVVLTGRGGY